MTRAAHVLLPDPAIPTGALLAGLVDPLCARVLADGHTVLGQESRGAGIAHNTFTILVGREEHVIRTIREYEAVLAGERAGRLVCQMEMLFEEEAV